MVYPAPTIRHLRAHLPLFAGLAAGLAAAGGLIGAHVGGGPGFLTGIWALPDGDHPSPGTLLVGTALASGFALLVFIGALAARGRWRIATLAGLGLAAAGGATRVTFGRPGGDSMANLAAHAALDPSDGHLFVGGEFLGHLWFVPWLAAAPDAGHAPLLWAARAAGWPGLAGLLVCAVLLAGRLASARERGLTACVTCTSPFVLLLLGYPQSTALMSALVPAFMAVGLFALGSTRHPVRWAAACGALLALACTAHGAAYVLGLGALWLLGHWIRRREVPAVLAFTAVFAVLWVAVSAAEWSLIHRARTMPWSFLAKAFEPSDFAACFGGHLLGGGGPGSWAAAADELRRWTLSLAPLAGVTLFAVVAVALGRATGRAGSPSAGAPSGTRIAFLGLCSVGGLALWATWNVWYGYPADWDVTAIAAVTLQLACVALLVRLPQRGLREASLGFALPLQVLMILALGSHFTGTPA